MGEFFNYRAVRGDNVFEPVKEIVILSIKKNNRGPDGCTSDSCGCNPEEREQLVRDFIGALVKVGQCRRKMCYYMLKQFLEQEDFQLNFEWIELGEEADTTEPVTSPDQQNVQSSTPATTVSVGTSREVERTEMASSSSEIVASEEPTNPPNEAQASSSNGSTIIRSGFCTKTVRSDFKRKDKNKKPKPRRSDCDDNGPTPDGDNNGPSPDAANAIVECIDLCDDSDPDCISKTSLPTSTDSARVSNPTQSDNIYNETPVPLGDSASFSDIVTDTTSQDNRSCEHSNDTVQNSQGTEAETFAESVSSDTGPELPPATKNSITLNESCLPVAAIELQVPPSNLEKTAQDIRLDTDEEQGVFFSADESFTSEDTTMDTLQKIPHSGRTKHHSRLEDSASVEGVVHNLLISTQENVPSQVSLPETASRDILLSTSLDNSPPNDSATTLGVEVPQPNTNSRSEDVVPVIGKTQGSQSAEEISPSNASTTEPETNNASRLPLTTEENSMTQDVSPGPEIDQGASAILNDIPSVEDSGHMATTGQDTQVAGHTSATDRSETLQNATPEDLVSELDRPSGSPFSEASTISAGELFQDSIETFPVTEGIEPQMHRTAIFPQIEGSARCRPVIRFENISRVAKSDLPPEPSDRIEPTADTKMENEDPDTGHQPNETPASAEPANEPRPEPANEPRPEPTSTASTSSSTDRQERPDSTAKTIANVVENQTSETTQQDSTVSDVSSTTSSEGRTLRSTSKLRKACPASVRKQRDAKQKAAETNIGSGSLTPNEKEKSKRQRSPATPTPEDGVRQTRATSPRKRAKTVEGSENQTVTTATKDNSVSSVTEPVPSTSGTNQAEESNSESSSSDSDESQYSEFSTLSHVPLEKRLEKRKRKKEKKKESGGKTAFMMNALERNKLKRRKRDRDPLLLSTSKSDSDFKRPAAALDKAREALKIPFKKIQQQQQASNSQPNQKAKSYKQNNAIKDSCKEPSTSSINIPLSKRKSLEGPGKSNKESGSQQAAKDNSDELDDENGWRGSQMPSSKEAREISQGLFRSPPQAQPQKNTAAIEKQVPTKPKQGSSAPGTSARARLSQQSFDPKNTAIALKPKPVPAVNRQIIEGQLKAGGKVQDKTSRSEDIVVLEEDTGDIEEIATVPTSSKPSTSDKSNRESRKDNRGPNKGSSNDKPRQNSPPRSSGSLPRNSSARQEPRRTIGVQDPGTGDIRVIRPTEDNSSNTSNDKMSGTWVRGSSASRHDSETSRRPDRSCSPNRRSSGGHRPPYSGGPPRHPNGQYHPRGPPGPRFGGNGQPPRFHVPRWSRHR